MSKELIIAKKTWLEIIARRETKWIIIFLNVLLITVLAINFADTLNHNRHVSELSQQVRKNWEDNPDKHPHRMSHYGYVAFRSKYPLSFFDKGLDSYFGNSVFLEAHKQNTVNFSEQSFSNGLLAFGEISAAMILQLLLTLLIFFWGYGIISKERESGMLQLLVIQGARWRNILFGKSLGLFFLSLTICLPVLILGLILLPFENGIDVGYGMYVRYAMLFIFYILYFLTLCLFTVLISAIIRSSKLSLTLLVGYWLFFVIIFPKISVVVGQTVYPTPTKAAFDIMVEKETLKHGDSHTPNDPYFTNLKDSLLIVYKVNSTKQLPFNYAGFVMKEGEKLSSRIYNDFKQRLVQRFILQQDFVRWVAMINPYMAIKNISLSLSGTDYLEYVNFEEQTEKYRYFLAQYLNDLQIKHIANDIKSSADKRAVLDHGYWKAVRKFQYSFIRLKDVLKRETVSILSLLFGAFGIITIIVKCEKSYKIL